MDLGITGIIDLLIIAFGFLFIFIGYKKGFMNKALSIAGAVVLFAFSLFYCVQLAGFFKTTGFIYNSIYHTMERKVENNLYPRFAVTIEKAFGIHAFWATILAFLMGNPPKNMTVAETSDVLAFKTTTVISFLIIFVTLFIALVVLKILAMCLREQSVIKRVDGVFGIVLYLTLYAAGLLIIFFVLNIIYKYGEIEEFNRWLEVDLALNSNKFRIGKNLLNNNYLVAIKNLFFK